MPKISKFFVFLSLIIFNSIITSPRTVYAVQDCPNPKVQTIPNGETAPRDLKNNDSGAEFTIDVNRSAEEAGGVTGWIMEWECGDANRRVAKPIGENISTRLKNVGGNCAFRPHVNHIIKVKATVAGKEVDYCQASYKVFDSDKLCNLSLDPSSGITTATQLKLSGTNLTPGGNFVVFVDESPVGVNAANVVKPCLVEGACVKTPVFEGDDAFLIPTSPYMTPGSHTISLRRKTTTAGLKNPLDVFNLASAFDPPLCNISYTVGNATNPGSVTGTSTGGAGEGEPDICKINPKDSKCSSAGGITCDTGTPDEQGILTAIGCVPSQPQPLVEGLIKFITFGSGGIALLLMIFASFRYITSAGNPDSIKAAWDQFQNAFIGLLFVLFSVLLLQIIGVDILGIPGLSGI